MLNLLFYDFIAIFKKLWYYILIIAAYAFVVRILWSEPFMEMFGDDFLIAMIIRYVVLGFLCAFGILLIVMTIMFQAQWFDENILSAQGQLTNMYPISSVQLAMSKVINSVIWAVILVLVAVGVFSVFCVGTDIFAGIVGAIADLSTSNNINISFGGIMTTFCFLIGSLMVSMTSLCCLSQTIGQIFSDFKNLMVLISFFVILLATTLLIYFLFNVFGVIGGFNEAVANHQMETVVKTAVSISIRYSVVNIALGFLYGFLTGCILRARLNIM